MNKNVFFNIIYKAVSVMMIVVISVSGLVGCGSKKTSSVTPGSSILPAPTKSITDAPVNAKTNEITIEGVLSSLDKDAKKMRFVENSSGIEYEVPYTGGTDIQTKYGTKIAPSNMRPGEIYEVTCDKKGTALTIYGAKDAWERTGITGLDFDESTRKITIGSTNLVYAQKSVILSDNEKISISQIVKQDTVILRGVDSTVYSIVVDVGHGYIKFTGVSAFEGGYASIGKSQLVGVTDNMLVTAATGTYDLELDAGTMSGKKTVTVEKNKETTVDFSEYKLPVDEQGAVNFKVTPSNAVMTIDGEEVDYTEPVMLKFGSHVLTLAANYYEAYTETFTVSSAYSTKVIDMTSKSASTKSSSSSTTAASTNGYKVNVTAPAGAALYVDSVYVGIVPCSFEKKSGTKTITLTQNGYNTISYSISIANSSGDLNYAFPDMTKKE